MKRPTPLPLIIAATLAGAVFLLSITNPPTDSDLIDVSLATSAQRDFDFLQQHLTHHQPAILEELAQYELDSDYLAAMEDLPQRLEALRHRAVKREQSVLGYWVVASLTLLAGVTISQRQAIRALRRAAEETNDPR